MSFPIIRVAKLGDELAIAKVHIQAWQEAYHGLIPQGYLDALPTTELENRIKMWVSILANSQRWAWVAENANGIVGFVLFGPPRDANREGFIELGAIYLLASEKNKGIGFSLLSAGFNKMKDLGYQKAYCWVLENNPTIKFYERTGAKFSGQTKQDEIGGKNFNELAYEWESLELRSKKIQDWSDFRLVMPVSEAKHSFLEGLKGIPEKSEKLAWIYLGDSADINIPEQNFPDYAMKLLERQAYPSEGFVCDTVYWAFFKDKMIGRISIRHELNDFLKQVGGHIGYIVHPNWRNKGVASWMLSEILKTDRAKSIGRLLLTCDEDNIASERTILKNGGIFTERIALGNRTTKKHFWIEVRFDEGRSVVIR